MLIDCKSVVHVMMFQLMFLAVISRSRLKRRVTIAVPRTCYGEGVCVSFFLLLDRHNFQSLVGDGQSKKTVFLTRRSAFSFFFRGAFSYLSLYENSCFYCAE